MGFLWSSCGPFSIGPARAASTRLRTDVSTTHLRVSQIRGADVTAMPSRSAVNAGIAKSYAFRPFAAPVPAMRPNTAPDIRPEPPG